MKTDKRKETEIRLLVEKYYEGLTSQKEEKQIASFLGKNPNVKGFEVERAMFGYFSSEKKSQQVTPKTIPFVSKINYLYGMAAVITLVVLSSAMFFFFQPATPQSYAYINGRKITDQKQVRMYAQANLQKFSDNVDVEERELESFIKENNKIKKQLELFSIMGN